MDWAHFPDLVTIAYYLLGYDWRDKGHSVPPVMITVANRTETAARVKHAFDHNKIRIDDHPEHDQGHAPLQKAAQLIYTVVCHNNSSTY